MFRHKTKSSIPPVIVMGMHRSGTSLLSGILQDLGVLMGKDLDVNGESLFFQRTNEWIFTQAGATWDAPAGMMRQNKVFSEYIDRVLKKRLSSPFRIGYTGVRDLNCFHEANKPWGWKDPRNTFTGNIWVRHFPGARFIHIYRDPVAVMSSLYKREHEVFGVKNTGSNKTDIRTFFTGIFLPGQRILSPSWWSDDLQASFSLWKMYTSRAIDYKEHTLHLSYESLQRSPHEIISRITGFLGLEATEAILCKAANRVIPPGNKSPLPSEFQNGTLEPFLSDELVRKLGYGV